MAIRAKAPEKERQAAREALAAHWVAMSAATPFVAVVRA